MEFAEALPENCPPAEANNSMCEGVFRLLSAAVPDEQAFKSGAALGLPCPPTVSPCRWASCSLVLNAAKQKKLPKFKDTHHWAARLNVPENSGVHSTKKGSNHIDFWWAKGVSPLSRIAEIVEV